jgi:hypothetical protein
MCLSRLCMGFELKWVLYRKYGRAEDVNAVSIGGYIFQT